MPMYVFYPRADIIINAEFRTTGLRKNVNLSPIDEQEITVKRKERTAECPVDSQTVSARREFTL